MRLVTLEKILEAADLIFVSTVQERDEQYHHPLYESKSTIPFLENRFVVAPPGANTKTFSEKETPIDLDFTNKFDKILSRDITQNRLDFPYLVLASRLDPKKNHLGLIKAYAKDKSLQKIANVAISLRGIDDAFKDYSSAKKEELEILDEMMDIIKTHHLEGMISFVNINSQLELASIYRYLAKKKSIFVLTSLYEPFGLAPIEAMSSGLPGVVTKNGGPKDVLEEDNVKYGVLVDPFDIDDIAKGIHEMFSNYERYRLKGKERVNQKYTWDATASTYLKFIQKVLNLTYPFKMINPETVTQDILDTKALINRFLEKSEV